MKLIGNIIWFVFGGLILGLLWTVLGVLLCITIVGIPFGTQCFKVAKLSFAPLGRSVKLHPTKHLICNIIWAALVGWWLVLFYLVGAIFCFISIVGFTNGVLALKLMKLSFMPFGAKIK